MPKYVFPAIFTLEENDMYSVRFPDIKNCFTSGKNLIEALEMAQDALCLTLYDKEEEKEPIPQPSDLKNITINTNEFISLITCDTLEYRKQYHNHAVKKTLTIPAWLNTQAEQAGVNFSQILQEALKEKLQVKSSHRLF